LHEKKTPNTDLREQLSVLYRIGPEINEMYKMLKRTDPIDIELEVNEIRNVLTKLVPYVVRLFGKSQALYIVTPPFQRLSGLWP
jgi:hypothetical protein